MKWSGPTSDRKSTRLNSSHTVIYPLSLHDALPIWGQFSSTAPAVKVSKIEIKHVERVPSVSDEMVRANIRSEEHTSELQSHSDLPSFPTRRSSDLGAVFIHRPCRKSQQNRNQTRRTRALRER